jgi:Cu(I)/Ag(I) efflux system membrane protein CusA/SilA
MLDEGTTLDMPVTVPRASVTQAADDLKARDALIRSFPEVEGVVGKAGRAETSTDPAPLDMVETFVNFRPRELWPKRVIRYVDAAAHSRRVLAMLEDRGYVTPATGEDRDTIVNEAAQKAIERFDEVMRELALRRYQEFERELGPILTRFVVAGTVRNARAGGQLGEIPDEAVFAEGIVTASPDEARRLTLSPAEEVVARVQKRTIDALAARGRVTDPAAALELQESRWARAWNEVREAFGRDRPTLAAATLRLVEAERMRQWRERVKAVNWELFDRGTEAFTWFALEELGNAAQSKGLLAGAERGADTERFATAAFNTQVGRQYDSTAFPAFAELRAELDKPFRESVVFRQRTGGPKGDLVDDEFGRVLQVPGWSNIFTQPIVNRIEMLSTGVRTDIGIKVFGPDLATVTKVCQEIEAAVKPVPGARDVVAAPIMGKGYLEVTIDRVKAGRFGVSVEDVQTEIETALGGRVVTYTVEERDRFPVRVRYARAYRDDEEAVRRLLVPESKAVELRPGSAMTGDPAFRAEPHAGVVEHTATGRRLIPLTAVADIRITEGPAVIKGENGRPLNYVTLNVRGRDAVGFVEEAKRVVAQKVKLPEGVHVEWAGEFEHQERAARTLRWVFPAVIIVIFLVLFLTYRDLADAGLMMLAVPEALAGGAFFLFLFPKLINGWDSPPLDFSVAVWVGFIACFGMATETGIIMLVYLREAIDKRGGLENIRSLDELRAAVVEGAVQRLRPKLLTEGVAIIAIFPMVFATGVGAEVLAPMALPVLGGLLISDEVVDLFLPVRFFWIRRARWLKLQAEGKLNHQRTDPDRPTPAEFDHERAALVPVEATEDEGVSHAGAVGGTVPPAIPGEVRE